MQICWLGKFIIVKAIYKLAKKSLPSQGRKKGPKRYITASEIAVLAWVVLSNQSYRRALDDLKRLSMYRRIGLERVPGSASVSRWKRSLLATVVLLIRLSFYRLARTRIRGKSLVIVDGTSIRLGRASSHYLKRVRKRREYLLLTVLYAPEIDAFFDAVAAPDTFSEIEALRNYLLDALVNAGIFWGVLIDKRFDAADVIEALERRGLVPILPARTGKLAPRGGSRLRAWMNYETFRGLIGNVRSLIEAAFSSLKAMVGDVIHSKSWKARICDAFIAILAYNVARITALSPN